MNKKCIGCGAVLQTDNEKEIGYIEDINKELCNRCFRIKHYADYKKVEKDNADYLSILKEVSKTKDLVVLVADLFLWNHKVAEIIDLLDKPILLVLTKRDVLPYTIKDEKWIETIGIESSKIIDTVVVSSANNYHFDELYEKINAYQKSEEVYVVGCTNAGKSTMINTLMQHYTEKQGNLTTSIMPSTTLDCLKIPMTDTLTLIDTPGILLPNSFMNEVTGKELKQIMPKKEIKPITYQVKGKQYIKIASYVQIEAEYTNLTFYFSNALAIERFYKPFRNLYPVSKQIKVRAGEDIVIEGLGFIKCSKRAVIQIYLPYEVDVYTRNSLIQKTYM
ncbi:MAG: 50S ribosome-binding GTPase [Bacilli bacterium]|nr:50S ribosome-binding GTPase [Bacilli bacterium]